MSIIASNFHDVNSEIQKAQAFYEAKTEELLAAQRTREEAEIAMIRADSSYRSLRLQVTVAKSRVDALKEQSWNLRRESQI